MTLSPQDAATALNDIRETEQRSTTLHGYQQRAPHLMMWGVVWLIGYGLTELWPHYANIIWGVLIPAALVGDFYVQRTRRYGDTGAGWRYAAVAITIFVFISAIFFVMAPVSGRQITAFFPLLVAASYVLTGIWFGWRYIVAGVAIAVLTLVGFVALGNHFALWMAVLGGGALILAGFWLRRV